MTAVPLYGRIWRYGSIAFFCGLPLLLLFVSTLNLMQASNARDHIAQENATLSQLVAKLATHPRRELTPSDKAALYLTSTTSSLARAELQTLVTRVAEASGGHLAEVQSTGTPEQENDGTLSIEMTMTTDNKGLLDFLYDLEGALPLLTITDLNVRTTNSEDAERAGAKAPLDVEISVQGHFRRSVG